MIGNIFDLSKSHLRPVVRTAVVVSVATAMCACVDIRIRAGNEIDLPALQELRIGESTSEDVQAKLGAPFGTGRSYLPFQTEPIDMWSYYYELGTLSDDRRTFLFVYLDDGIFDGYMWMSSLPDPIE
jgi:hypothetical protein